MVGARVLDHRGEARGHRGQRGVDLLVLVLHRPEHRGRVGVACRVGVPHEHRPEGDVLDVVVVMEHLGEPRPSLLECTPGRRLVQRGLPHRRLDVREVAPEGVVHDVHAGLVVRTLGDVRLAREKDLSGAHGVHGAVANLWRTWTGLGIHFARAGGGVRRRTDRPGGAGGGVGRRRRAQTALDRRGARAARGEARDGGPAGRPGLGRRAAEGGARSAARLHLRAAQGPRPRAHVALGGLTAGDDRPRLRPAGASRGRRRAPVRRRRTPARAGADPARDPAHDGRPRGLAGPQGR